MQGSKVVDSLTHTAFGAVFGWDGMGWSTWDRVRVDDQIVSLE